MTRTALSDANLLVRAQQEGVSVEEMERRRAEVIPLKRANDPEDIAAMVVFLASPGARNITGQSFNVDGGLIPMIEQRRHPMSADPNQLILTGENPFIRLSETDGSAVHHQCQLLAHHPLPGGSGPRALYQERTDERPPGESIRTTSPWRDGCNRPCRAC